MWPRWSAAHVALRVACRTGGVGKGIVDLRTARDRARKSVSGSDFSRDDVSEKSAASRGLRLWLVALCTAGVGVFALMLYLRTLAPGVLYYARPELMDAAMLQVHATTLGITHPTGYPTWVMLTHLFTYLPFEEPAFAVNLASALYGALAVAVVFVACHLLAGRTIPAAVGALAFGLGRTFWGAAIVPDVYTLNALFVAAIVTLLLVWRRSRRERYLLLASLLMGLSLTNHLTSGLLLPAGMLFVWLVDRGKLSERRLMPRAAGLFALGLTPYLYLPIRASMEPPLAEAVPTTLGKFITHVSGSEVNRALLSVGPLRVMGSLGSHLSSLHSEFGLILLVVAAAGLYALLKRDRAAAALTGLPALGWFLYALFYDIPDIDLYLIPVYLMASLWIAAGAARLLREVEARVDHSRPGERVVPALLGLLVLVVALAGAAQTFTEVDRSDDREGRRIIETVAEETEPGSTVLHNRSSLWYMVLVEERRRDLTLLDPFRPTAISTHDLVWPADLTPSQAALRYATYDNTGVWAARNAAARGETVYILDQESANATDFLLAGFEIVEVEEGVLYRLEPPEPQQPRAYG